MKRVLLILFLLIATIGFAQSNPWEPYDHHGKKKPHPHPVVPEASTYGAALIGSGLLFVAGRRWWVNRNKSL